MVVFDGCEMSCDYFCLIRAADDSMEESRSHRNLYAFGGQTYLAAKLVMNKIPVLSYGALFSRKVI